MKKIMFCLILLGGVASIAYAAQGQAQEIDPSVLTPAGLASKLREKKHNVASVFELLSGKKKADGTVVEPKKQDGWEFMVKWAPKIEGDAVIARVITSAETWQPPVGDVGGFIGLYYQSHDGQQVETVFEI